MMKKKQMSKFKADLGLLAATVFWGTTFILSKIILENISLFTYLAIRLSLAAIIMIIISLPFRKQFNSAVLHDGMILGVFLFLSYLFQMWGLKYTSAINAGFITGMHVVFVPVFLTLIFKDRPKISSAIGVLFAATGLYFFSGGDFYALNKGDILVFFCAFSVTFHVIFTARFAPKHNVYLLTTVQLCTIALLSILLMFFENPVILVTSWKLTALIIYLALFGTVFTFIMQTAMQRFTTATRAALVFTMEPVFTAIFAFIIAGETLQKSGWLGGGFILTGMVIAEIEWSALFQRKHE
jgi:drug/metabolite transporter (DMT)-like permease